MGVTISSKRFSCDMGYTGFNRFREIVAKNAKDEVGKITTDNAVRLFGLNI